ncbi:hypothetical protein WR25_00661 [Diploscapter pachys]|uniref:Uncharacterized protein n=1 Tax=Diploscapter pachys TaxID=2018661 RepID=A0A2A2JIU8_9BILA|nr:hypothetical protein WR25_00661 [Diploscapter pachys]
MHKLGRKPTVRSSILGEDRKMHRNGGGEMYGRHAGWSHPQMETRRQERQEQPKQRPPHSRIVDQNEYDHYEYAQQRDEYNRYYASHDTTGYLVENDEERRSWHQTNNAELYENVPQANVRNVARIQISAADSAERERELEKERERLWKEQQEEQMRRNQANDRNLNLQRSAVESERDRRIQMQVQQREATKSPQRYDYNQNLRNDEEIPNKQHQMPNFNSGVNNHGSREQQHLRFESQPQPFHGDKHDFINGFGDVKSQNDERSPDRKQQSKKESSQTTGAIRAIINNLKGSNNNSNNNDSNSGKNGKHGDDRKEIPRHKVSTNPFLRNNDKNPTKLVSVTSVKNVAEVVQKMNSGDWPIRIEEDEDGMREERERASEEQKQIEELLEAREQRHSDKARQWETLDRKRTERRQTELKPNNQSPDETIKESPKDVEMIQPPRNERERRVEREGDKLSEKSEGHTTMSTDSAYSDDTTSLRICLPFDLQSTLQRKLPENVKELNDESEKLLLYFKGHRAVLNYLGIGLSEPIWHHINQLPDYPTEIRIVKPSPAGKTQNSTQNVNSSAIASHRKSIPESLLPHIKITQNSPPQAHRISKSELVQSPPDHHQLPQIQHHQVEITKVSHGETEFRRDFAQNEGEKITFSGNRMIQASQIMQQQQQQQPHGSPSSVQSDARLMSF